MDTKTGAAVAFWKGDWTQKSSCQCYLLSWSFSLVEKMRQANSTREGFAGKDFSGSEL